MTLADKITLLRIVLIPVFVIGLLQGAAAWPLAVFVFCALTDVLDGIVARWTNKKSPLGPFLDPAADKLLLNAAFLVLALRGRVPGWFFVVVFSRDLLILLGWNLIFILTRRADVMPRWAGRGTTFLQMAAVIALLASVPAPVRQAAVLLAAAATALSTVDYVLWGGRLLSRLG